MKLCEERTKAHHLLAALGGQILGDINKQIRIKFLEDRNYKLES